MTYKTVSCWSSPRLEDIEEFESYYAGVHVPHATRIPGATRLVLTLTPDGLGMPSAFYRTAELFFDTREEFLVATGTTEWAEMGDDAGKMLERFGVNVLSGFGTPVDAKMSPGAVRPGANASSEAEQI